MNFVTLGRKFPGTQCQCLWTGYPRCFRPRPLVRSLSSTRKEDPESSTPVPYGIFWPHLLQHRCISCRCRSLGSEFIVPQVHSECRRRQLFVTKPVVNRSVKHSLTSCTTSFVRASDPFPSTVQDPIWWIHCGPVDSTSFDPRYTWFLSQFISLYEEDCARVVTWSMHGSESLESLF